VTALAACPAAGAPSDALQGEQWAVAPDTVFDLPGAWALSEGAGVVVAVVDSGMRLDHPDLAPNAWTNFAEVPGNGADDDGNGYVDDVHGVDLTTERASQELHDGYGHGTHVSGTIAAAANGRGVVGVAFRAKLMTVKVLDDQGGGTTGAVAEGIRYAAANGARIINLSIESNTDDPRVRAAVEVAAAANVLVICSAGNSGENVDSTPVLPVSIPEANLVGVAATEPADGRALPDFSNFGRLTVPVAAPGVAVLSTSKDGTYEVKSGTSMAAPHVTGVAALMAAHRRCRRRSCARCCSSTPFARRRRWAPAWSTRSARCSRRARLRATPRVKRRRDGVGRMSPYPPIDRGCLGAVGSADRRSAGHSQGGPFGSRPIGEERCEGEARWRGLWPRQGWRGAARIGGSGLTRARRRWRLLGLGTTAVLLLTPPPPSSAAAAAARTISLSGASPAAAVVADLAFFYRRETPGAPRFSIVGGGTGTGIADAARGIVDAGLSGRALAPDDPPGLVFTPLALSAVCLVTNVANPVPNLTRPQIQDLVAGRILVWAQVPGSPRLDSVAPVAFDPTSAARAVFLSVFVDLTTPLAYQPRTLTAAAQVRDYVAATPAAWGYVDVAFARGLHVVPYEGVPCSRETIVSRAYPARRPLGFVTRGRPRRVLASFLRWIARDATANRVISTRYVVP
jgi:ABC-type phosphate transport system substrate-binding protein